MCLYNGNLVIGGKFIIGRILKGGMCINFFLNRLMIIRLRDYCDVLIVRLGD